MILTITPNTGLDRVLFFDSVRPNQRNQAADWVESMGCKGCDVSLVLRALGEETVATGLAAGDTGRRMESMLRRAGVTPDFVWTGGESRVNTVLVEREGSRHTTLCAAGLQPDEAALAGLVAWIERWAAAAAGVVLAGSLPECWMPEVYARLTRAARSAGRPLVVDATGEPLRHALTVGVEAIKPNRAEAESLLGPLEGREAAAAGCLRLRAMGAGAVLLSLGEEGALYADHSGCWHAEGVTVPVVNPAGAGDGMTACLILGLVRHWEAPEILRRAVAASAAIVTARGTAELPAATMLELLPRVQVRRLE